MSVTIEFCVGILELRMFKRINNTCFTNVYVFKMKAKIIFLLFSNYRLLHWTNESPLWSLVNPLHLEYSRPVERAQKMILQFRCEPHLANNLSSKPTNCYSSSPPRTAKATVVGKHRTIGKATPNVFKLAKRNKQYSLQQTARMVKLLRTSEKSLTPFT